MNPGDTGRFRPTGKNGIGEMRIKRSVSPDGRIDSVSVEITSPLASLSQEELAKQAEAILGKQQQIVERFLARNGKAKANGKAAETKVGADGTPARMIRIGGTDGKYGRRLFIVFDVEGERASLFGTRRQLAATLAAAGSPLEEDAITEGTELDAACRVLTKATPDGKFLNVEKVLPTATPS